MNTWEFRSWQILFNFKYVLEPLPLMIWSEANNGSLHDRALDTNLILCVSKLFTYWGVDYACDKWQVYKVFAEVLRGDRKGNFFRWIFQDVVVNLHYDERCVHASNKSFDRSLRVYLNES